MPIHPRRSTLLSRLDARKAGRGEPGDIGICQHATSGASGAVCDQHDARVAEFERASRISTIYAEVSHEMDCFGGTAQAACAIEGANADTEEFTRRIEVLASGQVPKDARVNRMEKSPAVSPPDLAEFPPDERERYRKSRDASIAARAVFDRDLLVFAAAVFPQYSRHQVRVMFRDL